MKDLVNKQIPAISLPSTCGAEILLSSLEGWYVIYIYPMIANPGTRMPQDWELLSRASGCTAQSCTFRNLSHEFLEKKVRVLGLSSQSADQQSDAKKRLNLPFELLSDHLFFLKKLLGLPTFCSEGFEYYERLTMIVSHGKIIKLFYPIESARNNAYEVLQWITLFSKNKVM